MTISQPQRQPLGGSLIERLMAVVRPEFRSDVFYLPRDSKVFFVGACAVPDCHIMIARSGLCEGHSQRWRKERKEAPGAVFDHWLISEGELTRRRNAPPPCCSVRACHRGAKAHGLCHRHYENWSNAGRPALAQWLEHAVYQLPDVARGGAGERQCAFSTISTACPRWTDGPDAELCRHHLSRWNTHGRLDLATWLQAMKYDGDPRLKMGHLSPRLRLELQFGIQCRYDEGSKITRMRTLREAVRMIECGIEQGLGSLLDFDDEFFATVIGADRGQRTSMRSTAHQFLRETQLRLHVLSVDDPWDDQFPRDTWDLRVLGIAHDKIRYFRFGSIPQPWLKALAKRWIRWRLSQGLAPVTLGTYMLGVTCFATWLPDNAVPEQLNRELLEGWLAKLALDFPDLDTRRHRIVAVSNLLRDTHRHEWQPGLSRTAMLWDDSPPRKPPRPRWIPEDVMAQMESEANIALFPSIEGQLVLRILMNCGLRLKDARQLPIDCLIHDATGAPYLAWLNYKMQERPAFFPISQTLAEHIQAQQQRVHQRFPDGSPWLFPGFQANLDGAKPASHKWFQEQLERWLRTIKLVHLGQPTRVTPHQFRHTVGTRLINADVPLHVVQQLLDHMSPEMTAVYARLMDTTVREHWERATKVNGEGHIVDLAPDHPLADAQWMKLSMTRAKVALPNGYCGAPIQTDCEYANPCLDCRFFLTTGDFLDAHRRQRDDTTRLIADAEGAGMKRVAEKNTRTLIKLETLIATLEKTSPRQIVAGGVIEDLDAAS